MDVEMMTCLAALMAVGFPLRAALRRFHVPPAVSLMTLGVLAGPAVLDVLPDAYLGVIGNLSKAAFVVLLLRAGFGLAPGTIRIILLPAILFGLVPVAAEMAAAAGCARVFLVGGGELALLAGFLVAAVSPAVILPTMLEQKDRGRGGPHLIPDRIMGQTVVNALIAQTGILLFLDVVTLEGDAVSHLVRFPAGLFAGLVGGVAVGYLLRVDALLGSAAGVAGRWVGVLVVLAAGFAVYFLGARLGVENVLATLAVGVMLRRRLGHVEREVRDALKQVWAVAEIILFANIGAVIDLAHISDAGLVGRVVLLVVIALAVRLLVARLLLVEKALTAGERTYLTIAHVPKATVQAVFGPVIVERLARHPDLAPDGQTLLVTAVVAIVLTAPVGAVALDRLGARFLERNS